ncbi:porin family protein [Arenicella xantha]|uniref:Outer membrane protein with beta-barrel domain n=1 Tax=Arenicella xantha TaxID=644221 RepID=A0A395JLV3_9GAMM|nr:porin family protein [Arenicella xantha]RBP50638.1 outer membrane protein with beta-barrel domain [Arenicella xantha]
MTIRQLLTIASLSAGLIAPTVSMADDTGPYIAASVNRASANFEDIRDIDFDDSDNAFGLRAGYMFTDLIGVEVAYLDLGEFSAPGDGPNNAIELDADGYSAALVLNLSVVDQLDLYVKAGAFRVNANADSFIAGQRLRFDDEATEPFAAFGAEWDLGTLNLFAEYSVVDTDISDLSVDIASAGVKLEF